MKVQENQSPASLLVSFQPSENAFVYFELCFRFFFCDPEDWSYTTCSDYCLLERFFSQDEGEHKFGKESFNSISDLNFGPSFRSGGREVSYVCRSKD